MIRAIGTQARGGDQRSFAASAHLKLHIKVHPDWTTSPRRARALRIRRHEGRRGNGRDGTASPAAGRVAGPAERRQVVAVQPAGRRAAALVEDEAGGHARSPLRCVRVGPGPLPRRRHRRPRSAATGILAAMRQQTLRALDEADVVAFVVDAKDGVTAVDSEVAKLLHKAGKPVLVAANKADNGGWGLLQRGVCARLPRRLPGVGEPRPRRQPVPGCGRGVVARGGGNRGHPRRSPATPGRRRSPDPHRLRGQAQRRQVVAGQLPAGRGAGPGSRPARHHARSHRYGVLVLRAVNTCWSTPRACAVAAQSTRAPNMSRRRWRAARSNAATSPCWSSTRARPPPPRTRAWPARSRSPGAARWSCSTRRTWSDAARRSTRGSKRRAKRWRFSPTRP